MRYQSSNSLIFPFAQCNLSSLILNCFFRSSCISPLYLINPFVVSCCSFSALFSFLDFFKSSRVIINSFPQSTPKLSSSSNFGLPSELLGFSEFDTVHVTSSTKSLLSIVFSIVNSSFDILDFLFSSDFREGK